MKKVLFILLIGIFLLSNVMAGLLDGLAALDNFRTFTPPVNNFSFGKVSIFDRGVLGITPDTKLEDILLLSNTKNCSDNCEAIKNITLYQDEVLIDSIKFETIKLDGNRELQPIRNYRFLIFNGTTSEIINDYRLVCINMGFYANTSVRQNCNLVKVGTHLEVNPIWVDYIAGTRLPAGDYLVKLIGEKKPERSVDWIITSQGIEIRDWAVWGSAVAPAEVFNLSLRTGTSGASGNAMGVRIGAKKNLTLVNVSIASISQGDSSDDPSTRVLIYNSTLTIFCSANVTGFWATFPTGSCNFTSGATYYVAGDCGGSSCAHAKADPDSADGSAAYSKTNINVSGSFQAGSWFEGTGFTRVIHRISTTTISSTSSIVLNSPSDTAKTNSNSVLFNATAIMGSTATIVNMSLFINSTGTFALNQTNTTIDGLVNTTAFNLNLNDGSYLWNVQGCDSDGDCGMTAANRTFSIDSIKPNVTLYVPSSNISVLNITTNVTINFTATDLNLGTCWFNSSENTTTRFFTCNSAISTNFTSNGTKVINYGVNDTYGNVYSNSTTIFINYLRPIVNYTANVIAGDKIYFLFDLTADSMVTAAANLTYNGTTYPMSLNTSNTTNANFNLTLTAPAVTNTITLQFNVTYGINGEKFNTSTYNQTINAVSNITTSCANPSMFFLLKDEESLQNISGTYEYNFLYGTNSSLALTYGSASGFNLSICVNTTLFPSWSVSYGEIVYKSAGYYDRRYYVFNGTTLNNITKNVNLYSLLTSSGTSFQLTVQNPSLTPYENIYSELIRWYPSQNSYNIVDMGKTDNKGQTVIHVKSEDVDYRIGAYYPNGTLIYLANPIRMVCSASPCTYDLNVNPTENDYTSFLGVTQSLDYNYTTGMWNYVYSDSSGKTTAMNLTIWRDTGTSSYIVCTSTVSGSVGAINCNTSTYTDGMLRAEVYRDDPIPIAQKIVNLLSSPFTSSLGLWLSILVGIPIIIVFVFISPIAALIGGVVALIPALYFGSINTAILGGFAVLAAIIAHFLKRL